MNETMKTLLERRSTRSYKKEQITDEELNQILEAGLFAPSGRGKQAAACVVIQDKETIRKISHMNAVAWDKPDIDPFFDAPTLIVVFADTTVHTYVEDGSACITNMLNAAHSLGVGSCWVHRARPVFDTGEGREMKKQWGLGDEYVGVDNVVLGYPEGPHKDRRPRREGRIIFADRK